eukprot:GHVS01034390.1.p1 GENE.GHVS01034390.1~~GHVS01034390.1.p1  ORF type:complete len:489 (-),score=46.61 GHVS01034390.1:730-2118(-)
MHSTVRLLWSLFPLMFLPYLLWQYFSTWGSRDSMRANLLGVVAELAGQHGRANPPEEIDASPQQKFLQPTPDISRLSLADDRTSPSSRPRKLMLAGSSPLTLPQAPKPAEALEDLDRVVRTSAAGLCDSVQRPTKETNGDNFSINMGEMVDDLVGKRSDESLATQAPKPAETLEDRDLVRSLAKQYFFRQKAVIELRLKEREAKLSTEDMNGLLVEIQKMKHSPTCLFAGPDAPDIALAIMSTIVISCVDLNSKLGISAMPAEELPPMKGFKWRTVTKVVKQKTTTKKNMETRERKESELCPVDGTLAIVEDTLPIVKVFYDKQSNAFAKSARFYKALAKEADQSLKTISQLMFDVFSVHMESFLWMASVTFCLHQSMRATYSEDENLFAEMFIHMRKLPSYKLSLVDNKVSCESLPTEGKSAQSRTVDLNGFDLGEAKCKKNRPKLALKIVRAYDPKELLP